MHQHSAPGSFVPDRHTDKDVLAHRLKVIDRRLAELDAALANAPAEFLDQSPHERGLDAERKSLLTSRREIENILHPAAKPKPDPVTLEEKRARNKKLLENEIRSRTALLTWNAEKAEREGEYAHARRFRLMIPEVGAAICREYQIEPALLGEIEQ